MVSIGSGADHGLGGSPGPGQVLAEAVKFLGGAATSGGSLGNVRDAAGVLLMWICVSGVIGVMLAGRQHWPGGREAFDASRADVEARVWSASVLVVAIVSAPLLSLAMGVIAGQAVVLPARYGLVLVPIFVACFAMLVPYRKVYGKVAAVAGGGAVLAAILLDYTA